jgi:hypothetical protein
MTREQIENMPAGREMDFLVMDYLGYTVYDNYYSADINSAWGIVEQMMSNGWCYKSYGNEVCGNYVYSFEFYLLDDSDNPIKNFTVRFADTAPLAICRAYLLYKMEAE